MLLVKLKGGDEHDCLTRWRHVLGWKPGEKKRIKRGYNKRVRRETKKAIAHVDHYGDRRPMGT